MNESWEMPRKQTFLSVGGLPQFMTETFEIRCNSLSISPFTRAWRAALPNFERGEQPLRTQFDTANGMDHNFAAHTRTAAKTQQSGAERSIRGRRPCLLQRRSTATARTGNRGKSRNRRSGANRGEASLKADKKECGRSDIGKLFHSGHSDSLFDSITIDVLGDLGLWPIQRLRGHKVQALSHSL
jgi:hypothetical protein